MKLTIEYNGGKQGFDLKQDLTMDIEQDAEAIGYIASCLFETAKVLAEFMEKSNPKYHERLSIGVGQSVADKEKEQNPYFPFTTFVIRDE